MESELHRLSDRGRYPEGVEGVSARYITLRSGLRVRVVESGAVESPAVILVPGWGCSAWIFHETMLPLAACGYRVIAVELKGHGFSDKPLERNDYTLESMTRHLIDIFDALELECAHVAGHSMGAAIAVNAALKSPHRFRSLALAAPVGFAGVRGMWFFRLITPAFAVPLLSLVVTRTFIRMMLAVVYGSLRRASMKDVEEMYAPLKTPGATMALSHLLHELDWRRPFPLLPIPILTLLGSEDVLSPASDAGRYDQGEVIVIEGAGHVLFDEAPEEVAGALCRFFGSGRPPYISTHDEQDERHS